MPLVNSRNTPRQASRKTPALSDKTPASLTDEVDKSSVATKRSSIPETPKTVTESDTAKRRRVADKDMFPTDKEEESTDASFDFGITNSLHGRRGGDHQVSNKQLGELESFVKDLCADRRRAARDAAKDQSVKPFSEAGKAEAMQTFEETLSNEKAKLQQMFNKLQAAFEGSQSMLDEYKAKVRTIRAQEEKDQAWIKQLEENVDRQLNELLQSALKPKGKKML